MVSIIIAIIIPALVTLILWRVTFNVIVGPLIALLLVIIICNEADQKAITYVMGILSVLVAWGYLFYRQRKKKNKKQIEVED